MPLDGGQTALSEILFDIEEIIAREAINDRTKARFVELLTQAHKIAGTPAEYE